jgi:hypothetical protein
MDPNEYFKSLKMHNRILKLSHFSGDECNGRGQALILDEQHHIAVMLEDCGGSGVRAGNLVEYSIHPGGEPKVIGSPANIPA